MPFDNLQETLKQKTFGIPNWALALGGALGVFVLARRNSSVTASSEDSGTVTAPVDGGGNSGFPGIPGPDPIPPVVPIPPPHDPQYPPPPAPISTPPPTEQPPYVPPPTPTAPQPPTSSYTSWPYFTTGQTFYSFDVINQSLQVKDTSTGSITSYGKDAVASINPSFLAYFS